MKPPSLANIPFFIINPVSGGGRGKARWEKLLPEIRKTWPHFECVYTQSSDDTVRQAALAVQNGFRWIIAGGGDGTLNGVVNGALQEIKLKSAAKKEKSALSLVESELVLGVFPLGSGDDFKRTLGWSSDSREAIKHLKSRKVQKIDIGRVEFLNHHQKTETRYFINVADFGLGGQVMYDVNRSTKTFGAWITYLYQEILSFYRFKPHAIIVETPETNYHIHETTIGVVANGRYFGCKLCIAPHAKIDDGLFDVLIVKRLGVLGFLQVLPKLYRGVNIEGENTLRLKATRIQVQPVSTDPVWLNLDGEQLGSIPATFEILPKFLNFCV